MFDPSRLFTCKLRDLGTVDAALSSIYAPESDIGAKKIGITKQFLERAEIYDRHYSQLNHFRKLVSDTLRFAGFEPVSDMSILDIGSGSGNTVIPMMTMFENARIVATDLSENLLALLRRYAGDHDNLGIVCMDASKDYFVHGSFDLVIGGYILHHIIDPADAIAASFRALKPGGIAIWFEPFEAGHAVMRSVLEDAMADCEAGKEEAPAALLEVFRRQVRDWKIRSDPNKSLQILHVLDDKHLFTRSYLDRIARKVGFEATDIFAFSAGERTFRNMMAGLIRLASLEQAAVPSWIWARIDRWDTIPSPALKSDLLFQGAIVMRKGP